MTSHIIRGKQSAQFRDEPRLRRYFARLGKPKVGEVRKKGVAGFEVTFKNGQRVEQAKMLLQYNRRALPKMVSLVHRKEEGSMGVRGGGKFDGMTLNGLPEVMEAMLIRGDKFAQMQQAVPTCEHDADE